MSKVSFGALAKAQDAISKQQSADRKRKRGAESSKSQDDKLQALRERLQEIKAAKLAQGGTTQPKLKARKTQPAKDDDEDEEESDASGSDSDAAPHARSSKHAPAIQSAKKAVSRKRQVIDAKKPKFRDPRFDTGPPTDDNTLSKRYAFLNDYKNSEMNELRDAIKKTKNEADKEKLKKKLTSMESQQKAQRNKDQQQDVLRQHKKKERELVKQGKQPFFLKKCKFINIRLTLQISRYSLSSSRTKEACVGRALRKHEIQGSRASYRAPAQEGDGKGAEEHARGEAGSLKHVRDTRYPYFNCTPARLHCILIAILCRDVHVGEAG